jgi:endo-1,3(4)-beta-glucanase
MPPDVLHLPAAANAYYAVSLLGIALNDTQMTNFGRLMLAMEVRSAQQYWYISSQSSVYQPPFSDNKLAGIMWSTKVDFGTWTGPAPEVVVASQIFPVSPIFELLVPPAWVKESYPVLAAQVSRLHTLTLYVCTWQVICP